MAHIRQSGPDSDLGLQASASVPFLLGSGRVWTLVSSTHYHAPQMRLSVGDERSTPCQGERGRATGVLAFEVRSRALYGIYDTANARLWPWLSGERPSSLSIESGGVWKSVPSPDRNCTVHELSTPCCVWGRGAPAEGLFMVRRAREG